MIQNQPATFLIIFLPDFSAFWVAVFDTEIKNSMIFSKFQDVLMYFTSNDLCADVCAT